MKVERISSRGVNHRPARELDLPDDFARRVIATARLQQRRHRRHRHVAAAVSAMLVAVALASLMYSGRNRLASRESPPMALIGWQEQSLEDARVYQLAQATEPSQVADYLLPDAGALAEFASAYTDASWRYDPNWSYSR